MRGKRADLIVHNDAPFNAEPPAAVLAEHDITATEAFYCRNHGAIPDWFASDSAAEQWGLSVNGDVTDPLALDYRRLTTDFAAHDLIATLVCAGNRRAELLRVQPIPGKEPWGPAAISTAVWRGARLADVLRAAGVEHRDDAHVAFTGLDIAPEATPPQPYGASIPLAKALSADVLLAWGMNGEPLPVLHGGPVRVVVPGFIGARSVKWISAITVQPGPSQNYFQAVDYRIGGAALTVLSLNCGIMVPNDGATVPAGPLNIHGYTIAADSRRIARVEVSLDAGSTWQPAELEPTVSAWAWRRWSATVAAAPGPLSVVARAWNDAGQTHPDSLAALWNPSGYGNNAWPRVDLTVQ